MQRFLSTKESYLKITRSNYVSCYWHRINCNTLIFNQLLFLPDWLLFSAVSQKAMEFHPCNSILITAIAGVFMALQINYKWNIPFIKSVLSGMWNLELEWHSPVYSISSGIFHISERYSKIRNFKPENKEIKNRHLQRSAPTCLLSVLSALQFSFY